MADKDYIKLVLTHIAIGFCIFLFPFLAKIYAVAIIATGLYFVFKNKNRNNEALYAAAYVIGSEVMLRATAGNPMYEYGKYFATFFIVLGICYDKIPKRTNPYWFYLLLLIPGVIGAVEVMQSSNRPSILFNISGPICLGICALYTYKRKITFNGMNSVLLAIGLPIVSYVVYLFFRCPLNHFVIGNTESNFILSGGYAPNQTATILGLGVVVFTVRLFLVPASRKITIVNCLILAYIYYRALLTFSRGGTITGVIVVLIFFLVLLIYYWQHKGLKIKIGAFVFILFAGFWLTSFQTNNLLYMRYADQNPNGLKKGYETNGRQDIAKSEIKMFEKNPILGVGVGEATIIRKSESGLDTMTHNELTRTLAEHGVFGMLSLLILILTPLIGYLKNKRNIIYAICFFAFCLLTINHSAMRIAAPAFLYALALLEIQKEEEISLA